MDSRESSRSPNREALIAKPFNRNTHEEATLISLTHLKAEAISIEVEIASENFDLLSSIQDINFGTVKILHRNDQRE